MQYIEYASALSAQNSTWVPIFFGNAMAKAYSRYYAGAYDRYPDVEFNVLFDAIKRR